MGQAAANPINGLVLILDQLENRPLESAAKSSANNTPRAMLIDWKLVIPQVLAHLFSQHHLDDLLGYRIRQPVRAGQIINVSPGTAFASSRIATCPACCGPFLFCTAFFNRLTPIRISVTMSNPPH